MSKTTKTKKVVAAGLAAVIAASTAMAGTLAWQSLNQEATNVLSGVVNPGGRLHDDFNSKELVLATDGAGEEYTNVNDKNVYVENFGTQKIFARIQLSEFLAKADKITVDNVDEMIADDPSIRLLGTNGYNDTEDYAPYDFTNPTSIADRYWKKLYGNIDGTDYLPTYNMNQDSLAPDLNGYNIYEGFPDEYDVIGAEDTDEWRINDGTVPIRTAWDGDADTYGTEYRDGDSNDADESDGKVGIDTEDDASGVITTALTAETAHTTDQTGTATWMSIDEWEAKGSEVGPYWVYDGTWAYWAQPIEPGYDKEGNRIAYEDEDGDPTGVVPVTGHLLTGLEDLDAIDEDYVYALHVNAQFVTANEIYNEDLDEEEVGYNANDPTTWNSGFYTVDATNTGVDNRPSEKALALLTKIGAITVMDVADEDENGVWELKQNDDPNTYSATYEDTAQLKVYDEDGELVEEFELYIDGEGDIEDYFSYNAETHTLTVTTEDAAQIFLGASNEDGLEATAIINLNGYTDDDNDEGGEDEATLTILTNDEEEDTVYADGRARLTFTVKEELSGDVTWSIKNNEVHTLDNGDGSATFKVPDREDDNFDTIDEWIVTATCGEQEGSVTIKRNADKLVIVQPTPDYTYEKIYSNGTIGIDFTKTTSGNKITTAWDNYGDHIKSSGAYDYWTTFTTWTISDENDYLKLTEASSGYRNIELTETGESEKPTTVTGVTITVSDGGENTYTINNLTINFTHSN